MVRVRVLHNVRRRLCFRSEESEGPKHTPGSDAYEEQLKLAKISCFDSELTDNTLIGLHLAANP